jgi:hypothetical protein
MFISHRVTRSVRQASSVRYGILEEAELPGPGDDRVSGLDAI